MNFDFNVFLSFRDLDSWVKEISAELSVHTSAENIFANFKIGSCPASSRKRCVSKTTCFAKTDSTTYFPLQNWEWLWIVVWMSRTLKHWCLCVYTFGGWALVFLHPLQSASAKKSSAEEQILQFGQKIELLIVLHIYITTRLDKAKWCSVGASSGRTDIETACVISGLVLTDK